MKQLTKNGNRSFVPVPELQNNLFKALSYSHISIAELSRQLGCSESTVKRWGRGVSRPSKVYLRLIPVLLRPYPIEEIFPYLEAGK